MSAKRKTTKTIYVGNVPIGGGNPIVVQSMTKTFTQDYRATARQITALSNAGCQIVRCAVPNQTAAESLKKIIKSSPIPVIADIHFDYKLAIESVKLGVHGIRINPGTIGASWKVKEVVSACKDKNVPIRVGANTGSLPKRLLRKYRGATADALVEAALDEVRYLEELGFDKIKISLKAPDVDRTIVAYRKISKLVDYPLHLGVTEAGPLVIGTVKSTLGIGILLKEGIGDTIRVSLTDSPIREVQVAWAILKSLGLSNRGIELISCPTCGRVEGDVVGMAQRVEKKFAGFFYPLKIAVMGCYVNGPGEAKDADLGVVAKSGNWILFINGKLKERLKSNEVLDRLYKEALKFASTKEAIG